MAFFLFVQMQMFSYMYICNWDLLLNNSDAKMGIKHFLNYYYEERETIDFDCFIALWIDVWFAFCGCDLFAGFRLCVTNVGNQID